MSIKKLAYFRFYEELNDFLVRDQRKVTFDYCFTGNPKIKDIIEMIGVPHGEIDLIVVNGVSVGFDYRLAENDRVAVYPVFEAIDISPINHLRPKPLRHIKFILDIHLGRLAKYLRICGFNSIYENLDDQEIVARSLAERRIILTKDRGLLKNKQVTHGYWVRAKNPKLQLQEIFDRFDLEGKVKFLVRCLLCNHKLKKIAKHKILDLVPANTSMYYEDFYLCDHCRKIYWQGSHYENMRKLVEWVKTRAQEKR